MPTITLETLHQWEEAAPGFGQSRTVGYTLSRPAQHLRQFLSMPRASRITPSVPTVQTEPRPASYITMKPNMAETRPLSVAPWRRPVTIPGR